jgi:hypothetical protein
VNLATRSATYGPNNADGKIIGEKGPRRPFAPTATLSRTPCELFREGAVIVSERIRPYRAEDAAAVREVHLQAFDGRGDELRLVELLHAAGAAPVSLVAAAEPDGRVVGHLPALSLRGEGRAEHRQVACGGAAQALRGLPRTPATATVRAGLPRRGGVAEGPETGRLRAQEARFAQGAPAVYSS